MLRIKNLFKQLAQTNNEIIEEIHETFEGASDVALAEAKRIHETEINPIEEDYGKKLTALGFTNTPLSKKITERKAITDKQRERAETIMKWQVKYPQYKLIFLDQVESICKKYGLLLGGVDRYKGSVPRKNIDEIATFKIKEEDWLYQRRGYRYSIYGVTKETEEMQGAYGEISGTVVKNDKCGFFICAPAKEMHVESWEKVEGFQIVDKDPIVLMPIEEHGKAFLIVSKWGLEGNDPSLVNEVQN